VSPGGKYVLKISFLNTGDGSIDLKEMHIRTTLNGKSSTTSVPIATKTAAPHQTAFLASLPDSIPEDAQAWVLEATVQTRKGDSYQNQITWSRTP